MKSDFKSLADFLPDKFLFLIQEEVQDGGGKRKRREMEEELEISSDELEKELAEVQTVQVASLFDQFVEEVKLSGFSFNNEDDTGNIENIFNKDKYKTLKNIDINHIPVHLIKSFPNSINYMINPLLGIDKNVNKYLNDVNRRDLQMENTYKSYDDLTERMKNESLMIKRNLMNVLVNLSKENTFVNNPDKVEGEVERLLKIFREPLSILPEKEKVSDTKRRRKTAVEEKLNEIIKDTKSLISKKESDVEMNTELKDEIKEDIQKGLTMDEEMNPELERNMKDIRDKYKTDIFQQDSEMKIEEEFIGVYNLYQKKILLENELLRSELEEDIINTAEKLRSDSKDNEEEYLLKYIFDIINRQGSMYLIYEAIQGRYVLMEDQSFNDKILSNIPKKIKDMLNQKDLQDIIYGVLMSRHEDTNMGELQNISDVKLKKKDSFNKQITEQINNLTTIDNYTKYDNRLFINTMNRFIDYILNKTGAIYVIYNFIEKKSIEYTTFSRLLPQRVMYYFENSQINQIISYKRNKISLLGRSQQKIITFKQNNISFVVEENTFQTIKEQFEKTRFINEEDLENIIIGDNEIEVKSLKDYLLINKMGEIKIKDMVKEKDIGDELLDIDLTITNDEKINSILSSFNEIIKSAKKNEREYFDYFSEAMMVDTATVDTSGKKFTKSLTYMHNSFNHFRQYGCFSFSKEGQRQCNLYFPNVRFHLADIRNNEIGYKGVDLYSDFNAIYSLFRKLEVFDDIFRGKLDIDLINKAFNVFLTPEAFKENIRKAFTSRTIQSQLEDCDEEIRKLIQESIDEYIIEIGKSIDMNPDIFSAIRGLLDFLQAVDKDFKEFQERAEKTKFHILTEEKISREVMNERSMSPASRGRREVMRKNYLKLSDDEKIRALFRNKFNDKMKYNYLDNLTKVRAIIIKHTLGLMDFYVISRMFKKFNDEEKPYMKKIFIHGGETHAEYIINLLIKKFDFKYIEGINLTTVVGDKNYKKHNFNRCMDITKLRRPFFS